MICIYHSRDLDGWTSAAIVKKKYPHAELIGWDYGEEIIVPEDEDVIMVDVSFTMDTMAILGKVAKSFLWIDHHKSAIKEFNEYFRNRECYINAILNDKIAACESTWLHLFDKPMPEAVRLLGMYDSFRHKGTDEEKAVMCFQYAARALINNPERAGNLIFGILEYERKLDYWIEYGGNILQYLSVEAKQIYSKRFEIEFDGYKFAAVNRERFNPVNFGIDYHADGYDGFACFCYDGKKWTFSLYNDNGKVDCSEICKKRKGGGHKGAAGFTTTWLDGTLFTVEERLKKAEENEKFIEEQRKIAEKRKIIKEASL